MWILNSRRQKNKVIKTEIIILLIEKINKSLIINNNKFRLSRTFKYSELNFRKIEFEKKKMFLIIYKNYKKNKENNSISFLQL